MELTDIVVLIFILTCFAAFMSTLAWASRPPRRTEKRLAPQVGSRVTPQAGELLRIPLAGGTFSCANAGTRMRPVTSQKVFRCQT